MNLLDPQHSLNQIIAPKIWLANSLFVGSLRDQAEDSPNENKG